MIFCSGNCISNFDLETAICMREVISRAKEEEKQMLQP